MEDTTTVIQDHQILFCHICRQAVRPGDKISSHFRLHRVKGQLLADIVAYYEGMALNDPVTEVLPADGSRPVRELPILDGFSCTQCRFLSRERDNLTRH